MKIDENLENTIKTIKVSLGMTINIGNYENIKIDTEVMMEKPEGGDTEKMFEYAWKKVQKEVFEKATEAKKLKE